MGLDLDSALEEIDVRVDMNFQPIEHCSTISSSSTKIYFQRLNLMTMKKVRNAWDSSVIQLVIEHLAHCTPPSCIAATYCQL